MSKKKRNDETINVASEIGSATDQHLLSSKLTLEEQNRALRDKLKAAEAEKKSYSDELSALQEAFDKALNMKEQCLYTPVKAIKAPARGKSETTPVIQASDWHVEEEVKAATVNGMNEHSMEISARRQDMFWGKNLALIDCFRTDRDINTGILHLGGDFITGHIHDDLVEMSQMAPNRTLLWVMKRLRDGIDHFRKKAGLKRLIVVCSDGNHGRSTHKKRVATRTNHSWEWLMYQVLQMFFEGAGNKIEFHIAEGYHTYVPCYDYDLRFHHGDEIKYSGGVGGITIPVKKAIANWNKSKAAYYDFFGHYHQVLDVGNFVCNGSMIGYNAFALAIKAEYEPAAQSFTLINSKRGNEGTMKVHLQDA
jgi:hypothetical protein